MEMLFFQRTARRATRQSQEQPSIICLPGLLRALLARPSVPCSSLNLSGRRLTVSKPGRLSASAFPLKLPEYSNTLFGYDIATQHEVTSWSAIGQYRTARLYLENSTNIVLQEAPSSQLWTTRGLSVCFEAVFAVFRLVFLRDPTAQECMRLCRSDPNRYMRYARESHDPDSVPQCFDMHLSRIKQKPLDRLESCRLWSFCLNCDVPEDRAETWAESYDYLEWVCGFRGLTTIQKDRFFQELFGFKKLPWKA